MSNVNSKIGICNLALAMLGADSIRSFDEKNKRARMADVFFDFTRDFLLTKFDWPFAKRLEELQELADDQMIVPQGWWAYQLPNECHAPRDIHPPGSREPWKILGTALLCRSPGPVYLYFTAKELDVVKYTSTFCNLVALGLAVKMGPVITQDKQLIAALEEQFIIDQNDAWESDANMGNEYREADEDPNNDTFVNPDGNWDADDAILPIKT